MYVRIGIGVATIDTRRLIGGVNKQLLRIESQRATIGTQPMRMNASPAHHSHRVTRKRFSTFRTNANACQLFIMTHYVFFYFDQLKLPPMKMYVCTTLGTFTRTPIRPMHFAKKDLHGSAKLPNFILLRYFQNKPKKNTIFNILVFYTKH